MKPGQLRQLDALVADKVMGLEFMRDENGFHAWLPKGSNPIEHCRFSPEFPHDVSLRKYSTDPVAAKQVREKLWERYRHVTLAHYEKNNGENPAQGTHYCIVRDYSKHPLEVPCPHWFSWGPTEELATVLCALRAYNVEIPKEEK